MTTRFFSDKARPVHMGRYPSELLARASHPVDLSDVPAHGQLTFENTADPFSIVNAMREHQAMTDTIRDGLANRVKASCPDDPLERSNHLKAFSYFADAAATGV